MEKQIKMSLETAREFYKGVCQGMSGDNMKKLLLENFTKEELEGSNEIEQMYESFKKFSGEVDLPWTKEECMTDSDKAHDNAYRMLKAIIKSVNGDWKLDFNKDDYKYYPWFDMRKEVGSGFVDGAYFYYYGAIVPACLLYANSDNCLATANKYEYIYKVYMNG